MTLRMLPATLLLCLATALPAGAALRVGFAEVDITPRIGGERPVYLAGYGQNRAATGVHDALWSRAAVLSDGEKTIALVSVDLVGLQYPAVLAIRKRLPAFDYVMVSSTHNHEGPDVVGLWGPAPIISGFDRAYQDWLIDRVVESVRAAAADTSRVTARYGTASDETLLRDSRLPVVKDGTLRLLSFHRRGQSRPRGMIVQWNCHPESMGSRNTLLTADFTTPAVRQIRRTHDCPVLYVTGAVGGLMTPPGNRITDDDGTMLGEGDFRFTERYGQEVGKLATRAFQASEPIQLTPLRVAARPFTLPVANKLYVTARLIGVLPRPGYRWTGNPAELGAPLALQNLAGTMAVQSEVACLGLGELRVVCIPGEIYPELVYGKYQQPLEADVDFPDSALEKSVVEMVGENRWMLFGLANDEIGYIIPRRQWDQNPPFAYGRDSSQYGEMNSCGPETAVIVMKLVEEVIMALR